MPVACWGDWGPKWGPGWSAAWLVKPKRCMFNGDEAHYKTVSIEGMRWRSWGRPTACGRGVLTYNQGYRTRTRFCLYERALADGYGRIRGVTGRRYCLHLVNGDYRCGLRQRPHHYRTWTL